MKSVCEYRKTTAWKILCVAVTLYFAICNIIMLTLLKYE